MLIDRTSTFRGRIVDHGVSLSTNGFPQWVAQLIASEIYDEEKQVWVDWSEYDVNEITSYQVLFGSNKKETLAVAQIKKITGWEGNSFQALTNMDLTEVGIQFRVEENTYEGKTSLQVAWVDEYDAVPGRRVAKLDAEDLKKLDAQYAQLLKQTGKKAAPAKAPVNRPPSGVATQTATQAQADKDQIQYEQAAVKKSAKPTSPPKVTAKGIKPTQKKGSVKKTGKDPLGPPASEEAAPAPATRPAPPKLTSTPDPDFPTGHCTKDEAWNTVYDLKAKNVGDEDISKIWSEAVREVAPGGQDAGITDEQWFLIKEIVAEKTAMF